MSIISLKNVSKEFNTKNGKVNALKNINLNIEKGDVFGIIGPSGAGKSTLIRCMNLLEKPTGGSVYFDGVELSSKKGKELNAKRKDIGMIFQQFNLLMQRDALSNAAFPLELAGVSKKEAAAKAEELMELVGLKDKLHSYPSQLSGGQKQRVGIARALATNPKVLLCDEATSALDPESTKVILKLLKKINKEYGITIVVITHEMEVVKKICNKVSVIDKGEIVETGFAEDVLSERDTGENKIMFLRNDILRKEVI